MVKALPFMRAKVVHYEEEATIVADLSGLAEVIHESDDAKIRANYEVSKITPMRPVSRFSDAPKSESRPSKLPLIAAAVGGALALAGVAGSVLYVRNPDAPQPLAAHSSAAPTKVAGTLTNTLRREVAEPAANSGEPSTATEPAQAANEPDADHQAQAPRVRSRAPAPAPRRQAILQPRAAEPPAAATSGQAKPASQAEPGADLRAPRHAPGVQIDMEDPYQ
jgi:hypothetical protein